MSFRLDGVGLVHPNGQRALQGLTLATAAGERVVEAVTHHVARKGN